METWGADGVLKRPLNRQGPHVKLWVKKRKSLRLWYKIKHIYTALTFATSTHENLASPHASRQLLKDGKHLRIMSPFAPGIKKAM